MNHSRRLRLNVNIPLPHILKIAAMHAGSESLRFNPCLLLSRKPCRLPPLSQSAFAPGASITSGRVQPYCSLLLPTWPGSLLSDTGSSGLCCRQVPCLQLSVCWCPARPNCPDVIAVTKCIASVDPVPEASDAHIRIYKCPSCSREMRLTVWASDPAP